MISELLDQAISQENASGNGYDYMLCASCDFNELVGELTLFRPLKSNEGLVYRGYRVKGCDSVAPGCVVFHSPNKPRTLIVYLSKEPSCL